MTDARPPARTRWSANELQAELARFEDELVAAKLSDAAVRTYIDRAATFLRWLDGTYVPRGPRNRHPEPAAATDIAASHATARAIPGLAREVTSAFWSGRLELHAGGAPPPGWSSMPEVRAADRVRACGGDSAAVRRVLTLGAAMDRARDADVLWNAAGALYAAHPWVFDPQTLVARPDEVDQLLRDFGVSQRHGPDAHAWRAIGASLCAEGPVRTVVELGTGDAGELLAAIRRDRSSFPLLRGPKIGPLWVRMLAEPGSAKISGLNTLPVAVDVQVKRISEYLGISDTAGVEVSRAKPLIQNAWLEDVSVNGCDGPGTLRDTCAALDPALWFWAKWGCMTCERAGRKLPIAAPCEAHCRFPARN